ncbi:hypothetical protein J1N35_011750 [Gossypium stocksii]|uniref:Uncharacterized protein n=1 Tax=Gossypium stocksii TaxID=47602 RepID=A0A9D4ABQ6_9ROSI|nr:hypothetical protein J1N35_011750 [Gossypium stocksii]
MYRELRMYGTTATPQIWSYIGVVCRCHVSDMVLHWLTSIRADAMSQTWSYTSSRINANAMSQTWSYTSTHIELMPCPRHGLTLALVSSLMPCPRRGLTLAYISSQCHVPDMVLH